MVRRFQAVGTQWGHRGKGPKHERSLFAGTGGGRTAEGKVRLAGEAWVSPGWACDAGTVSGLHSGSVGSGMGAAPAQPSPPLHPDSPPLPAHQLRGCWCPLQSTAQALSFKLGPSSIPPSDSRGAVQTPHPGQEPGAGAGTAWASGCVLLRKNHGDAACLDR